MTAASAAVAAGGLRLEAVDAAVQPSASTGDGIVDTNVLLSRWPFRRLPLDETPALVAKLRKAGVIKAWAGSFDAMLHKDLGSVNGRLAEQCRKHGKRMLMPFGAVNPMLPDWKEELRRCHEVHEM